MATHSATCVGVISHQRGLNICSKQALPSLPSLASSSPSSLCLSCLEKGTGFWFDGDCDAPECTQKMVRKVSSHKYCHKYCDIHLPDTSGLYRYVDIKRMTIHKEDSYIVYIHADGSFLGQHASKIRPGDPNKTKTFFKHNHSGKTVYVSNTGKYIKDA